MHRVSVTAKSPIYSVPFLGFSSCNAAFLCYVDTSYPVLVAALRDTDHDHHQ